jgi:type IV pilus assembly protein PilB
MSSIHSAIIRAQKQYCETKVTVEADDESIVGIVNSIIAQGIDQQASDIHIEPTKDHLHIRFRQDGVLLHHRDYPRDLIAPITNRIKIMAQADIAERRKHQGGRVVFEHFGRQFDLRLSFYVTIHGEKIVLRILNQSGRLIDITELGMAPRMLARFQREALKVPSGVTLVTGPTGSGKTTTVYSCIEHIKDPEKCIITVEDPVEIVVDGIAQCSINPRINLTFNETLKHIVRQDPDVIVIGEIRDNYTAEVAVQAALTGHKVLTTFHTEDSIGGLVRLLNMDIEAFLISSTVVCVVAQRLLRKVCPKCQESYTPTRLDIQQLGCNGNGFDGADFRKGSGCSYCRHTGYKGRIAVFELLILDEAVRDAILNKCTSFDIRKMSIEGTGLVTLLEDGLLKAVNGLTTIDEILRCLPLLQKPRELSEIRRLVGE